MSKAYEFLKECSCFYLLTINGDFPSGRPFGAIMEKDDKLYFSTNDYNDAHKQHQDNGNVCIVAKKDGVREWIRIVGIAKECDDIKLKQNMINEDPRLLTHFESAFDEHDLLFEVTPISVEIK